MIYVCEYDGQADDRRLQERAEALLLPFHEKCGSERQCAKLRQRILARMLLDFALQKEYGCSLTDLGLKAGPGGKPESTLRPDIRFNISHCATACACMVGAYETGLDIERKFFYRENLARRICTSGEWAVFETLEQQERAVQLHFLWSLKESCVKWDGRGLAYGMQRIDLRGCLPLVLRPGESRMAGAWVPDEAEQAGRGGEQGVKAEQPGHGRERRVKAEQPGHGGEERAKAEQSGYGGEQGGKAGRPGICGRTGVKNSSVPGSCRLWLQNRESYTLAVCCEEIPADGPYHIKETELLG